MPLHLDVGIFVWGDNFVMLWQSISYFFLRDQGENIYTYKMIF